MEMKLPDSMSLTFDDQQGPTICTSFSPGSGGRRTADGSDTCWEKHTFLHSGRAVNTPLEPRHKNTELHQIFKNMITKHCHFWRKDKTKRLPFSQPHAQIFDITVTGGGCVLTHQCGRPRPAIPPDSCRFPGPHRPPHSCSPEGKSLQRGNRVERDD